MKERQEKIMAKTICKLLGVVFILVGLIGFAKSDLLGAHLSTAHNLVHIISGAVALYFGSVYLLLGVVGFIMGSGDDKMLNVIPNQLMLGTADHAIHILLGIIFLAG